MMSPRASVPSKVFISATSADLGTVRRLVKQALLKIDCMPVEQEDFPPDYRLVTEFLRSEIEKCDAVIHIAGMRYGAEPNPSSLAPGALRRSYTQLEYDIARTLGRPVYCFVCSEDFPYDSCEAEGELQLQLQLAHRQSLILSGPKYERVSSLDEIDRKILALRLRIEKLSKQIRLLERRHLFAATIVVAALLVLGLISTAILRRTNDTGRDVEAVTDSNTKILKQTEGIISQGDALKDRTEQIAKSSDDAKAHLRTIENNVLDMVETDLINEIAEKAGVDSLEIKQLILQAKSADVAVLAYAEQLASRNRIEESASLARFVAETAIRSKSTDFRSASTAFRIAANAYQQQAQTLTDNAAAKNAWVQSEALAKRGLDALKSSMDRNSIHDLDELAELTLLRSRCLQNLHYHTAPSEVPKWIDAAIDELNEAAAIKSMSRHSLRRLLMQLSECLSEKSEWVSLVKHRAALESAIAAAKASVNISAEDQPSKLILIDAHLWAAITLRRLAVLQFPAEALVLLDDVAKQLERAAILAEGSDVPVGLQRDIQAVLGNLHLERSRSALDELSMIEHRDKALDVFQRLAKEAKADEDKRSAHRAAFGLFRANTDRGRLDLADDFFEEGRWPANQVNRNIFEMSRFVRQSVAENNRGFLGDAKNLLEQAQEAREAARKQNGSFRSLELTLLEAECAWYACLGYSKLMTDMLDTSDKGRENADKYFLHSNQAHSLIQSLLKEDQAEQLPPMLWLRAKRLQEDVHTQKYGRDEVSMGYLDELLARLSNSHPLAKAQVYEERSTIDWQALTRNEWSATNRQRLLDAIEQFKLALSCLSPDTSPYYYASLSEKISATNRVLSSIEEDSAKLMEFAKEAVRQLVLADTVRRKAGSTDNSDEDLANLLEQLCEKMAAEESAQIRDYASQVKKDGQKSP